MVDRSVDAAVVGQTTGPERPIAGRGVAPGQRFRRSNPCPICGGFADVTRGKGERCYGFLASDAKWAHCTREEHAGRLMIQPDAGTYPHRIDGPCPCGAQHGGTTAASTFDGLGEPVAVYRYEDEHGALLFEVLRFHPKTFRIRKPDGAGGWDWKLGGVRRVLYRLPDIVAAMRQGRTVYVVEGERDADVLAALGLVATTNPMGAGKWLETYSASLRGARRVVILPDNDEPGRDHARKVARSLQSAGVDVAVLELPGLPEHGDASDWLRQGGVRETLEALAAAASTWGTEGPCRGVDFGELAQREPRPPDWQIEGLAVRGDIFLLHGLPGHYKSWLAYQIAIGVATGGPVWGGFEVRKPGRVAYFDGEMPEDLAIIRLQSLLLGLDLDPKTLGGRARFWFEGLPLDDEESLADFVDELERYRGRDSLDLIVLDTTPRFIAGDEYLAVDVNRWFRLVKPALAALGGPTLLLVRHDRKRSKMEGPDRLSRGIGSIQWAANCTVDLGVEKRSGGLVRLYNEKARRRFELADFLVRFEGGDPGGSVAPLRLVREGEAAGVLNNANRTHKAVFAYLEGRPGRRATRQDIIAALKGIASERAVDNALAFLKRQGLADREGERGSPASWWLVAPAERVQFDDDEE